MRLPSITAGKKSQTLLVYGVVILTALIGVYILQASKAATGSISTEAEAGTIMSPAVVGSDQTASAGKYVKFGTSVSPVPPPPTASDPVIAAAGDIACEPNDPNWSGGRGNASGCGQYGTAQKVLALNPTSVLTLGDNQYVGGELANFQKSYDPTWGQFKSITHPVIGNHEYGILGQDGYWNYFGAAATPLSPNCRSNCGGYYSFNIGSWHIIALNSECNNVPGGCNAGSPQETWLKSDLASHANFCTLAYWHEPYWATGPTLRTDLVSQFVKDLYAANADVILNGHSHSYVRWAPMDPTGKVDTARGLKEFIVGTGGKEFTGEGPNRTNLEAHAANTFGIISMTLHPTSYSWNFIQSSGASFTDSGTANCH